MFNSQVQDQKKSERDIQTIQSKIQFITTGVGVPNFTPSGRAIYIRQDGGANTTLYVYEGSSWSAK